MQKKLSAAWLCCLLVGTAHAQSTVYRCPGEKPVYTDALTPEEAKSKSCQAIEGAPTMVCGIKNRQTGKIDFPCPPNEGRVPNRFVEVTPTPPPWQPRELSSLERWRYERCQDDATKAPTETGVRMQLRICKERFGQLAPQ